MYLGETIVKLNADFNNNSNIDIEFNKISDRENKMNITYLSDVAQNDGFSIELYKNKKETATAFNITFNNIANKKINKKLKIETKLEGTVLSNSISNSILIIYTDSSGEFKTTINSEINFDTDRGIETLNETNSFNLITAEEEYKKALISDLKNTITNVYNDKKEKMKLIDTNTKSSVISGDVNENQETVSEDNRDELRDILVNTVSIMMGEAQGNNETFTLANLNDLKIDGHNVSSIVNANLAIITIDGYTFNIDAEFNLSDGE